ncbi:uncharacterized protein ACNLHF_012695 [Anomaloglossus baeobatrachus]|uniref:uncharacterized protein LOC142297134 n=1 Tax=Anomaloglossus baeobatrachus TaxID=238106 RepID=UPI003F4F9040
MSFSTFSYGATEVTDILSKVMIPDSFLSTPTEEIRTRDYEKELRKRTAFELHCATLAQYHKVQRIPRGLRVSLRPTLFSENTDYCSKFESILNKCSMDIIVLTIEFLQKEIEELGPKIRSIEDQLTNCLPSAEWDKIHKKTQETILDFKKTLQERKRQKFVRDQEDYSRDRVYRWRSFDNFSRRPAGSSGPSRFSASSGSDSDSFFSRPPHFLEQRQSTRGRPGGGRGKAYTPHRVQTRSQVTQNL